MRQRVRSGKSGQRRLARGSWAAPLWAAWLASLAGCDGTIAEPTASAAGAAGFGANAAGSFAGPAVAPADAAMQASNPDLFATALRYFPEGEASEGPPRLFRLTRAQLDSTTQALLPQHYSAGASQVMPRDPLQTNYEYAENLSWNAANFTPYVDWVEQLAGRVRATPHGLIDCAARGDAPSCLKEQAERFLTKAFRGVTSAAQVTRYSDFFQQSVLDVGLAEASAELVSITLGSPHYVFRDEVARSNGVLSPAQQLQNLSYTLADAPPDALGLAVADAAAHVATPEALQRTIDQVLQTPAARQKLERFFMAWLEVREPDDFSIATDFFPEFTPELAAAVVEDTRSFVNQQLSAARPQLRSITQSTPAFGSPALAAIYAPGGRPDPNQRFGIFTQPAVIASHSGPTTTRLIKRGVFFTRKVMCLPLGLPPPGVDTTLPEARGATERRRVEQATASGQCQGCHALINPFGFMQENYDAIGRWRSTDQGQPIDASIALSLLDEGKLETTSPVAAFRALTDSLRFQQCFARQLFRFYMGRDERAGDDPLLRQMFFGLADGGEQDLVGMLETLARAAGSPRRSEDRP